MDELKNFIEKNRQAFDEEIPLPEGYINRFEQKLPSKPTHVIVWYSLSGLVIAASVGLLLFSIYPPICYFPVRKNRLTKTSVV
ncbi:MAG: hypothetical protein LIO97_03720 [Tannerellaceae bacterium]|nr:hypothetical protein [Tannerellaceae bacterium]